MGQGKDDMQPSRPLFLWRHSAPLQGLSHDSSSGGELANEDLSNQLAGHHVDHHSRRHASDAWLQWRLAAGVQHVAPGRHLHLHGEFLIQSSLHARLSRSCRARESPPRVSHGHSTDERQARIGDAVELDTESPSPGSCVNSIAGTRRSRGPVLRPPPRLPAPAPLAR